MQELFLLFVWESKHFEHITLSHIMICTMTFGVLHMYNNDISKYQYLLNILDIRDDSDK